MQELSTLGVGGVLENSASLGPRDELTLDGVGDVDGRGRSQATGGGEGGSPLSAVLAEDGAGGLSTADPAGV